MQNLIAKYSLEDENPGCKYMNYFYEATLTYGFAVSKKYKILR